MDTSRADRIEKQVLLRHPRSRVWRALTDSREFGDQIPLERRAKAFKENEGGWAMQMEAIEKHLNRSS